MPENAITSINIDDTNIVTFAVHPSNSVYDKQTDTLYTTKLEYFKNFCKFFPDHADMTGDHRLKTPSKSTNIAIKTVKIN